MADVDHHHHKEAPHKEAAPHRSSSNPTYSLLTKLQTHIPNSTAQLIGLVTLVVAGAALLILAGIYITLTVVGLIFTLTPILILSTPLWVPPFMAVGWFVSMCGLAAAAVGGVVWTYRYLRGMRPPGSDRVDYAMSRVYDTASHVKDYAREHGGFKHSKPRKFKE